MALLEGALAEGLEVVSDSRAELAALEVPAEAEDVQEELLDFYRRAEDMFEDLLSETEDLDLNDLGAVTDFTDHLLELQELGTEGGELVDELENL